MPQDQEKTDIALFYTHNDTEKAKNMISGSFNDLFVAKTKFSVASTYGAFLFFNKEYTVIVNAFVVISHSYLIDDKNQDPMARF